MAQTLEYNSFSIPKFSEEDNYSYLAQQISDALWKIIELDMRSDNPLFLKIKQGFIENLALRLVKYPHKNLLLGVSGESASGKSTLAKKILEICIKDRKDLYTIITSDNYYKDYSKELKEYGSFEKLLEKGINFDEPRAVNIDLLYRDLGKIKSGQTIYTPEYNFITIESIPHKIEMKPAKITLVEGLFVLEKQIRELLDISIFISTPADIIKDRWYKRSASRGKTGKAADMLYSIVERGAELYIRPYEKVADIVLSGITNADYIAQIADQIRSAIHSIIH